MAGLTPFQFSSGKRMFNVTSGISTAAYGTNLLSDTVKDIFAWQEMWINPNNIKWDSSYRQSQKQTAQAIVTFHFRPDYQILSCSGTAGWYRIKSQVEELKDQAIKKVISAVPSSASSDQLKKAKKDKENKNTLYLQAQAANTNATNKYNSVYSTYGELVSDSIYGYLNALVNTLTSNNYKNYSSSAVDSLYLKQNASYTQVDSTSIIVKMFDYDKDALSLIVANLINSYDTMAVCKTDEANAVDALSKSDTKVLKDVTASKAEQSLDISTYISTLTLNPTEVSIVSKLTSVFSSGIDVIFNSYKSVVENINSTTTALTKTDTASVNTITSMSEMSVTYLTASFKKLNQELKDINDTSYDDNVLKVFTKMSVDLDAYKSQVLASYNEFVLAASSTLTVFIKHKNDSKNVTIYESQFKVASDSIKSQSKTKVTASETELKSANANLAATKSNYEAAAQKYKNLSKGLSTSAKNLASSYSLKNIKKPSTYLKSGHSNRINNSPSLFLSRLKETADEPMYYIDKDGVDHYNPKYIKMFTKQFPDGVIYEGYFQSFNITETPDFETVTYDFRFVAEKKTPVTFLQRVLGMYSGYTSVAGDALNAIGS